MACQTCKLCNRLIISQAVTFADGVLTINIPDGMFQNCGKYCLVIAQAIPDTTTVNATVEITIGDGTTTFPLLDGCGNPILASELQTRTRYPMRVSTTQTGGSFRLLTCCRRDGLAVISSET